MLEWDWHPFDEGIIAQLIISFPCVGVSMVD